MWVAGMMCVGSGAGEAATECGGVTVTRAGAGEGQATVWDPAVVCTDRTACTSTNASPTLA